jgi:hypothetical protein
MNTVWIMTSWCEGAEGDNIIGVYQDFDHAAEVALKEIKRMEHDMFVHTEALTEVKTEFRDGYANYTLMCTYPGEGNVPMVSDIIELNRYEVS